MYKYNLIFAAFIKKIALRERKQKQINPWKNLEVLKSNNIKTPLSL